MLLRMDDLDKPRNKPGSADQILRDLDWLGLHWDGKVIYQSHRNEVYETYFEQLRKHRKVFPCRCSRKDIQLALSPPLQQNATAYPGTCRPDHNPVDLKTQTNTAWRFLVDDRPIVFSDQVTGTHTANLRRDPGDFVVKRKDDIYAYQFASVVDDIECNVTDIVRGEDLIDSTARQIALFLALNQPIPLFWHVPLLCDHQGNKLSKRDGALSLQHWRDQGQSKQQIIGQLAFTLGLVDQPMDISPSALADGIDISNLVVAMRESNKPLEYQ